MATTIYKTKDGKEFESEMEAIRHEKTLEKKVEVNVTQELMFNLIERASFNGFDGEKAVKFLKKNKELWKGATMGNDYYYTLRDIEDDMWHADTLKVLCETEENAEILKKKIKTSLSPDEISLEPLSNSSMDRGQKLVIRAWWD